MVCAATELVSELNQMGAQGWELVWVEQFGHEGETKWRGVLKKPSV